MLGRLKALFEGRDFPLPEDLLVVDFETMRSCGFSGSKIATIKAIAEAAMTGVVPTRVAAAARADEALIESMVAIKGVGRWTVEMLLIYSLARVDVLPVDDFGVRDGYRLLKALPALPRPRELRQISEAWAPHRTVAARYLWRAPRNRSA